MIFHFCSPGSDNLSLDGSFSHGHSIWQVPPFGLKRVNFLETTVVSFIELRSLVFLDFCHTPLHPTNDWPYRIFLNHLTFLTNYFAVLEKANLNIKKETFLHTPPPLPCTSFSITTQPVCRWQSLTLQDLPCRFSSQARCYYTVWSPAWPCPSPLLTHLSADTQEFQL